MVKDYYTTLGVLEEASLDTIKKAFREKAQELHPDKNTSPHAKQDFQELVEAYDILSKPEKREAYNAILKTQRNRNSVIVDTPAEHEFKTYQKEAEQKSRTYSHTSWVDFIALDLVADAGFDLLFTGGEDIIDGVGDILGDIFDLF